MTFRVRLVILQQSFNANYNILEFLGKFRLFSFLRGLRIRFPFGFSTRMIFLLWCVCGGFLLHFFESSLLDILLKPNYEDPVDSAENILDRGLKIAKGHITMAIVEDMKKSPFPMTRRLAERTVVAKVIFCYCAKFPF